MDWCYLPHSPLSMSALLDQHHREHTSEEERHYGTPKECPLARSDRGPIIFQELSPLVSILGSIEYTSWTRPNGTSHVLPTGGRSIDRIVFHFHLGALRTRWQTLAVGYRGCRTSTNKPPMEHGDWIQHKRWITYWSAGQGESCPVRPMCQDSPTRCFNI